MRAGSPAAPSPPTDPETSVPLWTAPRYSTPSRPPHMTAPDSEATSGTTAGTTDRTEEEPSPEAASPDGDGMVTRRRAIGLAGAGLAVGFGGFAVSRLGGPNDAVIPDAIEYAGDGPG